MKAPVRFDTKGIRGALSVRPRRWSPNRCRIGSSIRECAAMSMGMRWQSIPPAFSRASSASSAACGPEATHSSGALTPAMSRSGPSNGSSAPAAIGTLSIPPAGTVSNSWPRRCTSPMQSSKDITPATQAAAFSPMLCPTSAAGFTPQDIHSCASAYSTIRISGSWTEGRFSRSAASAASPSAGSHSARRS